jgi:Rrf2 family protein
LHVSRKADYAVRAMAYLASARDGERVLITEIAQSMAIPQAFLSKIMKELVDARLVQSQVGPGGGYALARPAERITFREILETVEGPWNLVPCQAEDGPDACMLLDHCSQVSIWDRIRQRMLEVFSEYTLAEVKTYGLGEQAKLVVLAERRLD